MDEQLNLVHHSAADRSTTEALVVEQDRAVVGLSSWIADAGATAARTGRVLQLLTPVTSRLTYPAELLVEAGCRWVVRDGNRMRDGIDGTPLRWTGERFAPVGPPAPVPDTAPGLGGVEIALTVVHPAEAEVGAVTATAVVALTGHPPAGWGTSEPVTQPWSPRELSRYCRSRAPRPTALVVVAPGLVGRLLVTPTDAGLVEEARLAGPDAATVATATIEALAAELAGRVRTLAVGVHPTRVAGLRPPGPARPVTPFRLYLDPSGAAAPATATPRA